MTTAVSKTLYRYDGPFEAVDVVLPSGRTLTVARGETVDALPSECDALDIAEGFTKAAPPKGDTASHSSKDAAATSGDTKETVK